MEGFLIFIRIEPRIWNLLTLRKSSGWFLTGAALVNTVVFSFIILCSDSFILGPGLGAWQFPLALSYRYFFKLFRIPVFFSRNL